MPPDETRRLLDELEAVTARLQDVEAALREQAERRSRSAVRQRLRTWLSDEAYARTRAFLRRHVIHHTVARAAARLPRHRSEVRTLPPVGYG